MARALAAAAVAIAVSVAAARTVTLSNTRLPLDTTGAPLLTGEISVLAHEGLFYLYSNVWGDCPSVDCCGSKR